MGKFQCLLFVLKRSCICYTKMFMAVRLKAFNYHLKSFQFYVDAFSDLKFLLVQCSQF